MKRALDEEPKVKAEPSSAVFVRRGVPPDEIAQHLHTLARAVGTGGAEQQLAAREAEMTAREAIIKQVLATPPRQCFSAAALAEFKRKHVAMMQYKPPQQPQPSAPSKSPPPGAILAPPAPMPGAPAIP